LQEGLIEISSFLWIYI